MQEDYFKEITKAEALEAFKTETVLLLWDDNTESEAEDLDRIKAHDGRFGVEHSREQVISNMRDRIESWHATLERVAKCQDDQDPEIKEHYDCKQDLAEVMEQMAYMAAL